MAEPGRHLETLRAGAPLRVSSATLVPIERTVVHAEQGALGAWISAAREPYALVVSGDGGVRALSTGGAEVTVEELRRRIPGLEALLEAAFDHAAVPERPGPWPGPLAPSVPAVAEDAARGRP
jgi:hypothetical protein